VGHDQRGAIVLRQKWSRRQVEARLANLSPCLIGMEAFVGAHHLSRKLQLLGEREVVVELLFLSLCRPSWAERVGKLFDREDAFGIVVRHLLQCHASQESEVIFLQSPSAKLLKLTHLAMPIQHER
jgi:hypothetical protein